MKAKRAIRPKDTPRPRMDEKDRRIVEAVYHSRLMTTDQLQQIAGYSPRSRSKINDRLRSLWGWKYLDRPQIQFAIYAYEAERPQLHALGDEGARFCRTELGLPLPKSVQWARKNKELKDAKFIRHKIGVAAAMTRFQMQLEAFEGFRLVQSPEVVATSPAATLRLEKPFKLPTAFTWIDNVVYEKATEPDWGFQIEDSWAEGGPKKALTFLEWDEDTEPWTTKNPMSKASILQKDYGYADIWQRKLHTQRFGAKAFRRLFVTTGGESRVNGAIELYRKRIFEAKLAPAGCFLYTTAEKFLSANVLTDPIWLNGKREEVTLLSV